MFSADSFRFKPEFMRRVQVDCLDRNDIFDSGLSAPGVDYSLTTQVLNAQRKVLNLLMSDGVAQRILDSEVKVGDPKSALQLSELYGTLPTRSGASFGPAATSPPHAPQPAARAPARGSPARCCGRARRCPPTRARCSASRRARCARDIAAAQNRGGFSKEAQRASRRSAHHNSTRR